MSLPVKLFWDLNALSLSLLFLEKDKSIKLYIIITDFTPWIKVNQEHILKLLEGELCNTNMQSFDDFFCVYNFIHILLLI